MKDINIVRVKAYIGGCNNRPYVCNELPVSDRAHENLHNIYPIGPKFYVTDM